MAEPVVVDSDHQAVAHPSYPLHRFLDLLGEHLLAADGAEHGVGLGLVLVLGDRWCARAQRSRLAPFVKCARTMRQRRDLILNAVEHGISNGRVEGLNNKVRLIVRRAYGFHRADAALALVMLGAGPISTYPTKTHPLKPPHDPQEGQKSPEIAANSPYPSRQHHRLNIQRIADDLRSPVESL
ncbi:MAG: transposase [Acidimicrobiales bacterium]